MFVRSFTQFVVALTLAVFGAALGHAEPQDSDSTHPALRRSADLAGTWDIAVAHTGEACRMLLRPQTSANGRFLVGMTPACRHSMPALAKIAEWSSADPTHLALAESAGATVLVLAKHDGDAFTALLGDRTYTMREIAATYRAVAAFAPADAPSAPGVADVISVVSRRTAAAALDAAPGDIGGRYAVMREKRDTGCMLTLDDKSRVKGGERAQLAPGCRDQGIVIFDPTAWSIVKGELVLTARAGHKAYLQKVGEGNWSKDLKDGGKPLGLKKL